MSIYFMICLFWKTDWEVLPLWKYILIIIFMPFIYNFITQFETWVRQKYFLEFMIQYSILSIQGSLLAFLFLQSVISGMKVYFFIMWDKFSLENCHVITLQTFENAFVFWQSQFLLILVQGWIFRSSQLIEMIMDKKFDEQNLRS